MKGQEAMLNPKEHRLALFDDITALFRDINLELTGLMDTQSTTKQRRAIQKVQKLCVSFEKEHVSKLKKIMGV